MAAFLKYKNDMLNLLDIHDILQVHNLHIYFDALKRLI